MSKQIKNTVAVLVFFDQQKGPVTSNMMTEQAILLTKSKITRLGYKFSKYFRKKPAVKSRTRSRPRI